MSGKLYVVGTPIGNLMDITKRALEVLKSVDLVLCEDTRVTKKLMIHYEIDIPTLSYHQHSSEEKKLEILKALLDGKNIALVTDAGTPGISDPGNELIDFLFEADEKLQVVPIPGPSALASTLSVSGFDVNKFVFLGFMPKKGKTKLFKWLKEGKIAFCFYESPNRLIKTLGEISEYFGSDKQVVVGRELTKIYEEIKRGEVKKIIEYFKENTLKGEVCVVVEK